MAKIAAKCASVVLGETNVTKLPGVSVCRGGRGRSVTLTSMSVPQIHLYAAPTKYARISRGPTHVLAGMVSSWWIINAKVGIYFQIRRRQFFGNSIFVYLCFDNVKIYS